LGCLSKGSGLTLKQRVDKKPLKLFNFDEENGYIKNILII
jgi:hypothetical protein